MTSFAGSLYAMGATPDGGSPWLQFVPFVLVLGIFYFIILLPMRRKQQKVQQFLKDHQKHCLPKPFSLHEFRRAVRGAISSQDGTN